LFPVLVWDMDLACPRRFFSSRLVAHRRVCAEFCRGTPRCTCIRTSKLWVKSKVCERTCVTSYPSFVPFPQCWISFRISTVNSLYFWFSCFQSVFFFFALDYGRE
jgi:hypothetical protein